MTQLGTTQYYTRMINGSPTYTSMAYAGNDPWGYTNISKDTYLQGLNQQVSTAQNFINQYGTPQNASSQGYVGNTYDQGSIDTLKNQINQVQSGQGIYANGYLDPSFSRYQTNAPTPSEQYFTPEFRATLPPSEQGRLNTVYGQSNPIVNNTPSGMKEVPVGNSFAYAPITSPIGNGVPTTTGGNPTLPNPTYTNATSSYYSSLTQQVSNLQQQLDSQRQQQLDRINADKATAQAGLDNANSNEQSAIASEQKAKLDQITLEEQRFNDNYNTVQGLASQLTDLMTKGNALIEQEKGVTGLASIRDPRIQQTINSVTASAGVIKAAIDVYNGQMSAARDQLTTATSAITSAYSDQINYYDSIRHFYQDGVIKATQDQKDFADATIKLLEDKLKTAQDNATALQNEFLDPTKALAFAKAGITLETPQSQYGTLLEKSAYSEELTKIYKDISDKGYTALTPGAKVPAGATTGFELDSQGNKIMWYKKPTATTGTVTERNAAVLQSYSTAFVVGAKLSNGTPIIDTNGFITPTAWQQAIADYKGSRADFIKKYGYLLYKDENGVSSSYRLTTPEAKLITG